MATTEAARVDWKRSYYAEAAQTDALRKRYEALRKDAERYRWIRDSDWDCFDSRWLSEHDIYGFGPAELDSLIDAKAAEAPAVGAV